MTSMNSDCLRNELLAGRNVKKGTFSHYKRFNGLMRDEAVDEASRDATPATCKVRQGTGSVRICRTSRSLPFKTQIIPSWIRVSSMRRTEHTERRAGPLRADRSTGQSINGPIGV